MNRYARDRSNSQSIVSQELVVSWIAVRYAHLACSYMYCGQPTRIITKQMRKQTSETSVYYGHSPEILVFAISVKIMWLGLCWSNVDDASVTSITSWEDVASAKVTNDMKHRETYQSRRQWVRYNHRSHVYQKLMTSCCVSSVVDITHQNDIRCLP